MTRRLPTHAVVSLAALDLRRRPDHKSELLSQLLLGEILRVRSSSRDGAWWRIEAPPDGYPGWARTWGLVGTSSRGAADWVRSARGRVRVAYAELRTHPGRGALVSPLFWGGRLVVGPVRKGFRRARLPDGRSGWVVGGVFDRGRERIDLDQRIDSLLGVPYLWGGRTPFGLDCSAFTQLVLAERGVDVPRDAAHQFRDGSRLPKGAEPARGDLVFFGRPGRPPGHVGLALGGGLYAHCRGRVRINSLDPHNKLCDLELRKQFVGVRRPISDR